MNIFKEKTIYFSTLIECLLYFSLGLRIFAGMTGVLEFEGLSGVIVAISGLICIGTFLYNKWIPGTVVFFFLILIFANVTDYFIYGEFAKDVIIWFCYFCMFCLVAATKRGRLRMVIFISGCLILSVVMNGQLVPDAGGTRRLALGTEKIGSMFANSNAIAQISYIGIVSMLYQKAGMKPARGFILYLLIISLAIILLLTLSRQGLLMLCLGVGIYLISCVFRNKIEVAKFAIILIGVIFVFNFFSLDIMKTFSGYVYRFSLDSDRTLYLEYALKDITDNIFYGQGSFHGFSSIGILPHNSFLWISMAYGGICLLVYISWNIYLLLKVGKISFSNNRFSFEIATLFLMFALGQMTTVFAPMNIGYMFALSSIEGIHKQLQIFDLDG